MCPIQSVSSCSRNNLLAGPAVEISQYCGQIVAKGVKKTVFCDI